MSILSVKGGDIETRKKRHAHKEDSQNKERLERASHAGRKMGDNKQQNNNTLKYTESRITS